MLASAQLGRWVVGSERLSGVVKGEASLPEPVDGVAWTSDITQRVRRDELRRGDLATGLLEVNTRRRR